jgi:hypothetical protein
MNEGPQAYARFGDAMKTIVSVPKSSVLPEKSKVSSSIEIFATRHY